MKRYIFFILLLMSIVSEASSQIISGPVIVNGLLVPAEYTVLSDGTVGLGSGRNAAVSHYISGRIIVPPTITVSDKTYKVSRIMPMAFRLCDQIKVVIVREGITSIDDFAFVGCSSLVEVELPSTMQTIGTGVFFKLPKLLAVICKAETPPVWEYNDVCLGTENASLFVPLGTDGAYQNANFTKSELDWTTPEGWGTSFVKIHANAMEGFHIYSQEDMDLLRDEVNNPILFNAIKDVYLETDIDMSEFDWTTPIGDTEEHAFTGTFHGQGNYIRNMKVTSDNVAGLFGYYKGPKITGVRLENCAFKGKELAGGLVGQSGACTIDSCFVSADVSTDAMGGGIVGRTTGDIIIDRCVIKGANSTFTITENSNPCLGGIVGSATGATITNCAVIKNFYYGDRSGIFFGECTGGTASVDYSYSFNSSLTTPPADSIHIKHGEHVLLAGQALSILDYAGEKQELTYDGYMFETIYPASVLGLESWIYKTGQFPLPDCFSDLWPVEVNKAVYGPPALAEHRTNVLAPDEDIPASAWLDLSDMGFRHYRFKASQLWIDDNMDVNGTSEQIPLGLSRQITAENGILLEDTLYATKYGTVPVYEPIYLMDDNGNLEYDDEGNMIQIDSLFIFNKIIWEKEVFSLCLPYNVAIGGNCTLYQPTQIYDVDGETTAFFTAVRDNYAEAFRPYLLVVHNDTVPLGTRAKVECPAIDSKTMRLGDYEFEGTVTRVGNIAARERNYYMLEDETNWLLFKESGDTHSAIEPFTAFFHSVDGTPATSIKIVLDNDNPVISVGDFYYAINNENEDNVTAKLIGYHGRGGNVVVPATAPYVLYGVEKQVPLIELAPDIFTKSKAEVWSIDLSQCKDLKPVTIDRAKSGNPFYKVDERTIIYMPEGKAQAGRNNVIGTECQQLDITDGWDFVPPYAFHADSAAYDRILYAAKQQDGSYQSMTYTICLPFEVDLTQVNEDSIAQTYLPYYLNEDKEIIFSNEYPVIRAGEAYVLKVMNESVQLSATDVAVSAQPATDWNIYSSNDGDQMLGSWRGTFAHIDNEQAALQNAFTLYSNGKWYRIRSDEGRYRNAWVGAFRACYLPLEPPTRNNYSAVFKKWVAGDDDEVIAFPSDLFTADTDFSNYDDEATGITTHESTPVGNYSDAWFTLDGRKLNERPQTKGLYIYKGKKIIIK
ncbi:MAG: leucine-rich repeat protein [Prevotella sp.]|nr:leucine-rich repeat protein [Prevotella sp.]